MDCQTARQVWNHSGGLIAGLNAHMPGVMNRLERAVAGFVNGETNAFDESVKQQVGGGAFFTAHAEEGDTDAERIHDVLGDIVAKAELERYFSSLHNRPIRLGNMCCKSCITDDGTLTGEQLLAIQLAAVNTEPDGSRFVRQSTAIAV